jgi:hypothetical protein
MPLVISIGRCGICLGSVFWEMYGKQLGGKWKLLSTNKSKCVLVDVEPINFHEEVFDKRLSVRLKSLDTDITHLTILLTKLVRSELAESPEPVRVIIFVGISGNVGCSVSSIIVNFLKSEFDLRVAVCSVLIVPHRVALSPNNCGNVVNSFVDLYSISSGIFLIDNSDYKGKTWKELNNGILRSIGPALVNNSLSATQLKTKCLAEFLKRYKEETTEVTESMLVLEDIISQYSRRN